uniref:Uncharacterized protein n=1 Tax=Trichogramma kaykai TaxID=54128 RepID=A0ABD2WHE4_9HYME
MYCAYIHGCMICKISKFTFRGFRATSYLHLVPQYIMINHSHIRTHAYSTVEPRDSILPVTAAVAASAFESVACAAAPVTGVELLLSNFSLRELHHAVLKKRHARRYARTVCIDISDFES